MVRLLRDTTQHNSSIRVNGGFLEKEELEDKQLRRATKLIFDLSFDSLPAFETEDGATTLMDSSSSRSTSPWTTSSRKTGSSKGQETRQGLPSPITLFSKNDCTPILREDSGDVKTSRWSTDAKAPKSSLVPKNSNNSRSPTRGSPSIKNAAEEVENPNKVSEQVHREGTDVVLEDCKAVSTPSREEEVRVGCEKAALVTPSPVKMEVREATQRSSTTGRKKDAAPSAPPRRRREQQRDVATTTKTKKKGSSTTTSSSADAMMLQLEKQLGALQHLLQQNQQQLEVLTNENTKLSQQLKDRPPDLSSCEAFRDLQEAVQILQQENASWKSERAKLLAPQPAESREGSDSKTEPPQHVKQETEDFKAQLRECWEAEKESMRQQFKEQMADLSQSITRKELHFKGAKLESLQAKGALEAQLAQVLQTVQKSQNDQASMGAKVLERLEAQESRIGVLEQEQQRMQAEKKEMQQQLEQQILESESLRQELKECWSELKECRLERERDKELIAKLREEMSTTKHKFQQVEDSLKTIQKEHIDAVQKLEELDVETRRFMQQSWEDNSGALTIAHDRIADLEASFRKADETRQQVESTHAKKLQQHDRKIAEMRRDHRELQEVLAWTKTEKATVKGTLAEKDEMLKATKFQLQDTMDSLEAVTAEKDMVLEQLTANTEKCITAVTATEEMKTLLRKDSEQIEQLHLTVAQLECERDELNRRLSVASAELESLEDPEETAERRDSSYGLDLEELLRGMSMPQNFEDSMSFLGDHHRRSHHRYSSINALDELEADLRELLDASEEVLPPSHKRPSTMFSTMGGSPVRHSVMQNRKASIVMGERQMSILVAQKQRDSVEEEVLSQIRELN